MSSYYCTTYTFFLQGKHLTLHPASLIRSLGMDRENQAYLILLYGVFFPILVKNVPRFLSIHPTSMSLVNVETGYHEVPTFLEALKVHHGTVVE